MFMNQTVLMRFAFLFLAAIGDYIGVLIGSVVILVLLCTKKSYGAWYMKPIVPFSPSGMLDFLIAIPQLTVGKREKL